MKSKDKDFTIAISLAVLATLFIILMAIINQKAEAAAAPFQSQLAPASPAVKFQLAEAELVVDSVPRKRTVVKTTRVATSMPTSGTLTMVATGYCSCAKCCGKSNGITASGAKAAWGTIAAPRSFSFGTKMLISELPGTTFTVQDRGGAITGNRIDIWFPSHAEALAWGRRTIHVKIVR